MEGRELACGKDDAGRKLERVVRKAFPGLPLSLVHKLLRKGAIRVNGKRAGKDLLLSEGDLLFVPASAFAGVADFPGGTARSSGPANLAGAHAGAARGRPVHTMTPSILLENEHVIALNKPRGMLSHGEGGVDEFLLGYLAERIAASVSFKPAPMHRLDRNTTGVLLCSKSLQGARTLAALFSEGRARKRYIALTLGIFEGEELWEDELVRDGDTLRTRVAPGGVPAVTKVRAFVIGGGRSFLLLEPLTGRTHQLRAQCAHHGLPLAGDAKYGGGAGRYILHAERVVVPRPESEILGFGEIRAPLFPDQERSLLEEFSLDTRLLRELIDSF